ncbi:Hypothetical predicted protein [Octopus vulgaris]|uniref:Uncharacterized protein n=1 Tax=Octopus vulgaris TaxID=6645 RepID=A0AA36ARE2_OCTVU|nr:Hypothetical predicted protein [Octopus vulgaris]
MCDKQYCITFGQKPALACFICGQGIHEACYLKKINNHTIPDILGLHWLCGYCSPRATITNEPRTLPQTGRSKQILIGETDMANKSCHTQAIQVPLVNDKNEDNDMQTPTKQETGDPAEKDQTSHEKKQIQSKRSNEERPMFFPQPASNSRSNSSSSIHSVMPVTSHLAMLTYQCCDSLTKGFYTVKFLKLLLEI